MVLSLSNLKPAYGSRTRSRRVGRGPGSGRGKTAGRGTKGQRARTGGRNKLARIGLKRIMQRIPKHRGFTSIYKKPATVNVETLNSRFGENTTITPKLLANTGLVRGLANGVKILGEGTLTKAFIIKGCEVSGAAKEKIVKAGGKIEQHPLKVEHK